MIKKVKPVQTAGKGITTPALATARQQAQEHVKQNADTQIQEHKAEPPKQSVVSSLADHLLLVGFLGGAVILATVSGWWHNRKK